MHKLTVLPPATGRFGLVVLLAALAGAAQAQITVYEHDGFQGRSVTTRTAIDDLRARGFNDRGSSAVVVGTRWEICEDAGYGGSCRVLRPGQYASLGAMGLNDRVSSVRELGRNARPEAVREAPPPVVAADYRRRGNERLYEARVTGSRAVYGAPEQQRCWLERSAAPEPERNSRVPGALLGAVIGGILGHQVGGGSGRDLATIGGVVAGAAVGSRIGNARNDRDGNASNGREIERCRTVPGSATPSFWDVSYVYRGREHHVQLAEAPGATVTVNRQGEPRV